MKAFTGFLTILLLGVILGEDISDEDRLSGKESSYSGCLNYAGELYHSVRKSLPDKEIFSVSPMGVFQLLAPLLYAVNIFTSGTEINNLISPKCGNSSEEASDSSTTELQRFKVTTATVALVREGLTVDQQFVAIANEFDAHIYRTNFSALHFIDDFNKFVISKTNESSFLAIDSLLRETPSVATRLLFYNRVKFQAQFEQKFSLDDKKNLVAPQMQALHAHVPELKARVLGLPLLKTTTFLLILLPDEGATLKSVELRLRKVDVRRIPSKLKPTLMDITMERIFEHKYLYLRNALEIAGIKRVFNKTTADLVSLNSDLALDNVLVVSGINLTENGINTDSADLQKSATSKAGKGKALEFKAQGPLVYVISDSNNVYLMGRWSGRKS